MRHLILTLLLTLVPLQVGAQNMDESVMEARLNFLVERLDASKRRGQYWQYGWMGVSVGGAAAGIVQAVNDDGEDRAGHIAEAVSGAIGAGYLLMRPMEARLGADPIRSMPASTRAQKENQLLAAEALLERNAARAEERSDLKMHLGNLAFNLVAGAFVVGFGNLGDAGILAGSGAAAGALQLWSEPRRPLRDWEDYQTFKSTGVAAPRRRDWSLAPASGGVALRLRF